MLILESGETFGTVSGGCLEADVLERAKQVLQTGEAQVITYDTRTNDDSVFALNMGCNGVIRVLLESVKDNALFDFVKTCFETRRSGVAATLVEKTEDVSTRIGARLLLDADGIFASSFDADFQELLLPDSCTALMIGNSRLQKYENAEVFIEVIKPPLALIIFGAGADAVPLCALAKNLGWRVTVVDHRAAFATKERFSTADDIFVSRPENFDLTVDGNTAVVVMTHNYTHDKELLRRLLKTNAPYIGALGPKRRTESILQELKDAGEKIFGEDLQKLYAPVGLDIGVNTPEGIALSIIAEIQAVRAEREGGFLRNRNGSIYNRLT